MSLLPPSPFSPTRRRLLGRLGLLAAAWPAGRLLHAQEAPEVPPDLGFIRLVNAVGAPGRLKVRINGTEADPAGFKSGDATGAVGLSPASYQVELEHETLGKATLQAAVETGKIATVIAFKQDKPAEKSKSRAAAKEAAEKDGPRLGWHLDQSAVSPPEIDLPTLTLVQLTAAEEVRFQVSGKPAPASVGKPVRVPITKAMGAFPEVQLQGKAVCLLNFKFPADQLAVFFTGADGQLRHAQLRNDVQ